MTSDERARAVAGTHGSIRGVSAPTVHGGSHPAPSGPPRNGLIIPGKNSGLLAQVESARLQLCKTTDPALKSRLGQFFTPAATAAFMAALFPPAAGACRLLDAGAGIGSLAAAFLDRCAGGAFSFSHIEVDAFEIDPALHRQLATTLNPYASGSVDVALRGEDFIHTAADALRGGLFAPTLAPYTHAILNPPYKKIANNSSYRQALRRAGIETVNLYSAFVALALAHAAPGGQIVAIVPRSFCNGPYYRPFRDFIFRHGALHHVHLFDSRTGAFRDDAVLQENVIMRLERGGPQGSVMVSTSTDYSFTDLLTHEYPFDRIVHSDDPQRFVHIPTSAAQSAIDQSPAIRSSLADVGVQVSTGPVVAFRLRPHLRDMPGEDTVPLLHPGHFRRTGTTWPIVGMKNPNAIVLHPDTRKWLYPPGFYCVVRRLSSKEEKRRIVAGVVEPDAFGAVQALGFENHLNVFHDNRGGLPEALARGLAAFLNTTAVDQSFRRFNGHTQVNATDLKLMKYPTRDALIALGEWVSGTGTPTQDQLDARLERLVQ